MRRVFASALLVGLVAATASAQSANDFRWSGAIERGKAIEIKGVNGDVRAALASGNEVEVVAVKTARRSAINSVSVQVVRDNGNVTICTMYPTPTGRHSDATAMATRTAPTSAAQAAAVI